MRWVGNVAGMGANRTAYKLSAEKREEKRSLGRSRSRWVDNIDLDLVDIGSGGVQWIGLAQGTDKWRALVEAGMNLRVS
jgi:hypothetical protein